MTLLTIRGMVQTARLHAENVERNSIEDNPLARVCIELADALMQVTAELERATDPYSRVEAGTGEIA